MEYNASDFLAGLFSTAGNVAPRSPPVLTTRDFVDPAHTAISAAETRSADCSLPPANVCRCGWTKFVDVPIHGGHSTRRDCERCDRYISFPLWYGQHRPNNAPAKVR
jgi:hypothetical protein